MRVNGRYFFAPAVLAGLFVAACGQSDAPDDANAPAPDLAAVKTASEALAGAHIPTLDPATLNDAEIRKVVGGQPHCSFRYTRSGRPVLVASLKPDGALDAGVVKLNGNLVPLQANGGEGQPGGDAFVLAAPPVRLSVQRPSETEAPTDGKRVEADMVFEVGQQLKVGYGGFMSCASAAPHAAAQR